MEYRRVGSSGLKVSALSLGGWTTFGGSVQDDQVVRRIIHTAFEGGVNFFDQADVYANGKSEQMMGAVLKELPRHRLVVSSKLFWPMSDDVNDRGLHRKHVRHSIEGSLKRLGTDYLDLYFCHRYDPETPLEETLSALSQLVDQGKILYWGTSEWSAEQITEAVELARASGLHAPVVEQPQYSMLWRERVEQEILPVTEPLGMGLVVWSPLGMGALTGKYDAGRPADARLSREDTFAKRLLSEENLQKVRRLKPIADGLGVSRGTLALAWALRQKGVSSTIVGATRPEQMKENLQAADFRLTPDAVAQVDRVLAGAGS
ncbi:aldo/keto reductase [Aggregicoccus sp. 17bor-14]|uniref:aldo/keto reductase n=1 Tax=Myxococcaceae TaxID=31 RepID=UPI00129CF7C0|nr:MULTISPECIES: aldo/keto reductase [Myxococcaceae]MBF5043816.1 aldo/keto reductase [Simulacricoccus sp. 17bor-14]MRI89568.1 aldo/keto reductase [Aggregicoccus sp. 17bor-14]